MLDYLLLRLGRCAMLTLSPLTHPWVDSSAFSTKPELLLCLVFYEQNGPKVGLPDSKHGVRTHRGDIAEKKTQKKQETTSSKTRSSQLL